MQYLTPEQLEAGYVLILPGIEGRGPFAWSIRKGLAEAGVPFALDMFEWTLGPSVMLYNLRGRNRHTRQIQRIRQRVLAYRREFGDRPVHLIGHSGGGAMCLMALKALAEHTRIESAVLLAPCVSPDFDVGRSLTATNRGIWHFRSPGDFLLCGLGTLLFGTVDGHHTISAAVRRFAACSNGCTDDPPHLHDMPYRPSMVWDWNLGGHFGCVHWRFVRQRVAPILMGR